MDEDCRRRLRLCIRRRRYRCRRRRILRILRILQRVATDRRAHRRRRHSEVVARDRDSEDRGRHRRIRASIPTVDICCLIESQHNFSDKSWIIKIAQVAILIIFAISNQRLIFKQRPDDRRNRNF